MRFLAKTMLLLGVVTTCIFALMSHPPAVIGVESDPTKHVLGLAALMFFGVAAYPDARLTTIVLWLAAGSFAIEVLQGVPPFHRDPDFYDWLAGMIGVGLMFVPLKIFKMIGTRASIASNGPTSGESSS